MASNVAPIDALIRQVEARGGNPLAVFCYSLKDDPDQEGGVPAVFQRVPDRRGRASRGSTSSSAPSASPSPTSSEGTHTEATGAVVDLLERLDVPVLQAVLCTSSSAEWEASSAGLTPRDTAMNVVLPEFDGRINTVADQLQGGRPVRRPARHRRSRRMSRGADRVDFVARLALNFARLRRDAERREAGRDPLRQLPDQERPDRQRRRPRHARLGDEPAPMRLKRRRLRRRRHPRPTATP